MTSEFNTSPYIHTMSICNTVPDTPIQVRLHLPDDTTAEKYPGTKITVVSVTLTVIRAHLIRIDPLTHINLKSYAEMISQSFDLSGVYIGGVRNQQKVIIVIKIIVSDILNDMEWSKILPGVGEAYNILQLKRRLHVLRIDEEFYLIHQMGGRLINSCR